MSDQRLPEHYADQLDTISGLQEWRQWATGLAVVITLIAIAFFIGTEQLVAWVFYIVIVAIGVGTLFKNYNDARFLDRETRLASDQVKSLVELDDLEEFLETAESSLFRTHIESLHTIFLSHPQIDQSALIDLLHRRLVARNRLSELFSSLLTTLGLIGTIVGLIIMMGRLRETMDSFEAGNTSMIIQEIFQKDSGALGGLDAAFYTTLLGAMLGGVVLRVLSSIVAANSLTYVSHLAELTEVNVIPSLRNMAARLQKSGYYDGDVSGDAE